MKLDHIAFGALLAAGSVLLAQNARAQVRVDVGASVGGAWMPSAPPVSIAPGPDSFLRFPQGSTARLGIPLGFVGAGVYATVKTSRLVYVPTLGVSYFGAVGPSPRITASVDGSFVDLRPFRSSIIDVSLIGIGLQAPLRRWQVSADVTAGFALFFVPGTVVAGNLNEETTATALSPTVRLNFVGCRRFDPWTRLCAVLTPNVYSFGFFNGGMLSLRWEIGS
jgi:hypothetical protein